MRQMAGVKSTRAEGITFVHVLNVLTFVTTPDVVSQQSPGTVTHTHTHTHIVSGFSIPSPWKIVSYKISHERIVIYILEARCISLLYI